MATLAYNCPLAARFLLAELDIGVAPSRATPFYSGAQASLEGATCERLAKKPRWMAMRYAALHWGIMCGTIEPRRRPSSQGPSGGLTKCLVGANFLSARARLLGLPLAAATAQHGDLPDTCCHVCVQDLQPTHPSTANVPLG